MAIRISLKGHIQLKVLIPEAWTFSELITFLPEVTALSQSLILYRNHRIYDLDSTDCIKNHLGETFDCHFLEDKCIFRLKFEKLISTDDTILLPLSLNGTF